MIVAGSTVEVLEPFASAFPDHYEVESVEGTTAILLGVPEGFSPAFDLRHLKEVV